MDLLEIVAFLLLEEEEEEVEEPAPIDPGLPQQHTPSGGLFSTVYVLKQPREYEFATSARGARPPRELAGARGPRAARGPRGGV